MTSIDAQYVWEITPLQRGLVDSCFEEGQYETAILTLDQLRSSEFNPWPPHLRQVIYISLQSTQEPLPRDETDTLQISPSKLVRQHQYQLSFIPPTAVIGARRLLMSYLNTNTPTALSRSLPRRKTTSALPPWQNEGDSMVAKRSMCITQCKDCWELLDGGFLPRQIPIVSSPKANTRHRDSSRAGYGLGNGDTDTASSLAVAEDAWPLLEWLVSLFERDEDPTEKHTNVRHSPLLAEQIFDDNGKAYLDAPVSIVLHCLTQDQVQRQHLAGRLLLLLVNLAPTTGLDMETLVIAIYTRASSTLSFHQISLLISQLRQPTAIHALRFKVGLCQKLIGGLGTKDTAGNAPRPQPRTRMRGSKTIDKPETTRSLPTNKVLIPTATEILRLFETQSPEIDGNGASSSPSLWYKYQLMSAYGTLQSKLPAAEQDSDWVESLDESLSRRVHDVLQQKGQEAELYERLLESQISNWRRLHTNS